MVRHKSFVMRPVTRFMNVEDRCYQARPLVITSYAARGLNILCTGLRLSEHHHQSESDYVKADRDHVCGNGDIHVILFAKGK